MVQRSECPTGVSGGHPKFRKYLRDFFGRGETPVATRGDAIRPGGGRGGPGPGATKEKKSNVLDTSLPINAQSSE